MLYNLDYLQQSFLTAGADLGGRGGRGKFRQGEARPSLKFSGRGMHPLVFFQGGADFICPSLNINIESKSKNKVDIFL